MALRTYSEVKLCILPRPSAVSVWGLMEAPLEDSIPSMQCSGLRLRAFVCLKLM